MITGSINGYPVADAALFLRYASTMHWCPVKIVFLALTVLGSWSVRAQGFTKTAVTISLTDPAGVPIPLAQISVLVGASFASPRANENGQYTVNLTTGEYVWSVSAPGFEQGVAIIDLSSEGSQTGGTKSVAVVLQPWLAPADVKDSSAAVRQVFIYEPATVQDPEEYAVWSAVLAKKYDTGSFRKLVIKDRTAISMPETVATHWRNSEPDNEAFSDLQAKNKAQYALENKFIVKVPCILLSREAESRMFPPESDGRKDEDFFLKRRSAWSQFYQQYAGAQGILTISRVGFNADKNQAIVYITNVSSLMSASGKVFLLVKKNGFWEIQSEVMLWLA